MEDNDEYTEEKGMYN